MVIMVVMVVMVVVVIMVKMFIMVFMVAMDIMVVMVVMAMIIMLVMVAMVMVVMLDMVVMVDMVAVVDMVVMVDMVAVVDMVVIVVILVVVRLVIVVIDRTERTTGQIGQTKLAFKLDFPGNLCRAAFAILAMFFTEVTKGAKAVFFCAIGFMYDALVSQKRRTCRCYRAYGKSEPKFRLIFFKKGF